MKLRITATSYLNTIPFVYGIRNSGFLKDYALDLQVPSGCSKNLIEGKADIALVPVGSLVSLNNQFSILYNYCLGAAGKVKTVVLLSKVPLHEITDIYLDFESQTSVRLVKVLAEKYWKLNNISWHSITDKSLQKYNEHESIVAIGDKTFDMFHRYEFIYDLAEEWYKFTSLPFVFACWLKRKDIPEDTINLFNKAIEFGIQHKLDAVRDYKNSKLKTLSSKLYEDVNLEEYVDRYMSYEFDDDKQKAFRLFLRYLNSQNLD